MWNFDESRKRIKKQYDDLRRTKIEVALAYWLLPKPEAPCPCQSGRQLKTCHSQLGSLLEKAILAAYVERGVEGEIPRNTEVDPDVFRSAK